MVNGNSRSFAGNRYTIGPNPFRNRIQIFYASRQIISRSKVVRHHFFLTSVSKNGYTFDTVYSIKGTQFQMCNCFFETDVT